MYLYLLFCSALAERTGNKSTTFTLSFVFPPTRKIMTPRKGMTETFCFSQNYITMNVFGPLDVGYCTYFYWLSVFYFFTFCAIFASQIVFYVQKRDQIGYKNVANALAVLLSLFFGYFANRLLYSMCVVRGRG